MIKVYQKGWSAGGSIRRWLRARGQGPTEGSPIVPLLLRLLEVLVTSGALMAWYLGRIINHQIASKETAKVSRN